ncbi:MAG: hypothetical protein IJZ90_01700 [Clostridia bacterium]|nr:hypothetical protein [Clostridia bacterium]
MNIRAEGTAFLQKDTLFKTLVFFILLTYIVTAVISPLASAASDTILFNGSSVSVSTSGYTSKDSSGQYAFKSGLTYTISSPQNVLFNRYSLVYTASSSIKGTIYYTIGSSSYSEAFYLEAGYNKTFSSLIDSYLNKKTGTKISKLVFESIETTSATLNLHALNTKNYTVQSQNTVYLSNSRFKLGVSLAWGGGLNYLEDKKDNDSTVTNMLNCHDTGRLVQQSYYGTTEYPYVCGSYNGTTWGYNPVQGGDVNGNKSKLVDFSISGNTIYVKCRPLDWAKNNTYTYSYMENVYTIYDDYISVDNRFIDFSNYYHGSARDQELPAFYTISYLDKFTFYNGNKPWTNGSLITKSNLAFWGGNGDAYFDMTPGNTETWCAWTSSEKGYGIGLYTPGITTLLAGRFEYNGSKSSMDNATNYVAPLIQTSMKNFEAFEYSYFITTGTVSQMRSVFKSHKDDPATEWNQSTSAGFNIDYTRLDFDSETEMYAFSDFKHSYISQPSAGSVKFLVSNTTDPDAFAYIDYSYNNSTVYTNKYRYLVYSYMIPTSNKRTTYQTELFICTGSRTDAKAGYSITVNLVKDGKYHTEIIDLSKYTSLWPSTQTQVNKIRFDFFGDSNAGDVMYLSEFSLADSLSTANSYAETTTSTATADPTPSQTATASSKPNTNTSGSSSTITRTPSCNSPGNGSLSKPGTNNSSGNSSSVNNTSGNSSVSPSSASAGSSSKVTGTVTASASGGTLAPGSTAKPGNSSGTLNPGATASIKNSGDDISESASLGETGNSEVPASGSDNIDNPPDITPTPDKESQDVKEKTPKEDVVTNKSDGLPTIVVVIIIVAGVLVAAVLGLLIFFLIKKRKKKEK